MSKMTLACRAWRPLRKNTLLGFAIVEIRLISHDVAIHQKEASIWAQLPARPWVKDGVAMTDDNGKVLYTPVLEFDGREVRDAFSRAVVNAVRDYAPHAFEDAA